MTERTDRIWGYVLNWLEAEKRLRESGVGPDVDSKAREIARVFGYFIKEDFETLSKDEIELLLEKIKNYKKKEGKDSFIPMMPVRIWEFRKLFRRGMPLDVLRDLESVFDKIDTMDVKEKILWDWSRLISFWIWWDYYDILDSNLISHVNQELSGGKMKMNPLIINYCIDWSWMRGDKEEWEDKERRDYVDKLGKDGLYMPTHDLLCDFLNSIYEEFGVEDIKYKKCVFSYLTWLDWDYWVDNYESEGEFKGARELFSLCGIWWYRHDYSGMCKQWDASVFFVRKKRRD